MNMLKKAVTRHEFSPTTANQREYRQALGQFPTGVTIVTCITEAGLLGMTVNSFTSVSLDPPLVMWCPSKDSERYAPFMAAKYFAIHVLSDKAKELCLAFAKPGDHFAQTSYQFSAYGVPLLDDCLCRLECIQHAQYDGGDHSLILGRVEKVTMQSGTPLVFCQGNFSHPQSDDAAAFTLPDG